jgi:disulfide bond formation protein DsbB
MAANPGAGERSISLQSGWNRLFIAWLVALVATLGALFIGEILGQEPCNLCWYQRIAMFPLAILLGLATLYNDLSIRRYALPLAIIGGAVALWHTLLYVGLISEAIVPCSVDGPSCTGANMTVLGWIPLPIVSLACFVFVTLLLIVIPENDEDE